MTTEIVLFAFLQTYCQFCKAFVAVIFPVSSGSPLQKKNFARDIIIINTIRPITINHGRCKKEAYANQNWPPIANNK